MNKVTKGFMIAALIFIVLGIVVTIGAIAGGGLKVAKSMAENGELSYAWIGHDDFINWCIDFDGHDDFFEDDYGHDFFDKDFDNDFLDDNYDEEFFDHDKEIIVTDINKKIDTNDLECLKIDIGAGIIDISDSSEEEISIRTKNMRKVQIYRNGNTLYVKGLKSKVSNGGTIYIELPKDLSFDKIDISAGASELHAEKLCALEIDMDLGAGKIEADKLAAKEMEIEIGAGAAAIKDADIKDADINVGMGSFVLKGAITGDLEAKCDMGSLRLSLDGSEEDHNYKLDCSLGNLSVGGTSIAGVASERKIDNGTNSNYEMECAMGNLIVTFND